MSTPALARIPQTDELIRLTLSGILSPNTRRLYSHHLSLFFSGGAPLTRIGINNWLVGLHCAGKGIPTLNQARSAIMKFAREAHAHGMLSEIELWAIDSIPEFKRKGRRMGNWLSKEQFKILYAQPDRHSLQGKRDAACMALVMGCGLRRAEASDITWKSYQEREGRTVLVDLIGKGNKLRSVPVPKAASEDLDAWYSLMTEYGFSDDDERILRRVRIGSDDLSDPLSDIGVWYVIDQYAKRLNLQFSPHDLRRSMARLMYKNGADLEQIRLILGHAHIETTMRYINAELDVEDAATDLLELEDTDDECE